MFHIFKKKKPITSIFPLGFVDIHNHLLPGIDDGSKSLEESVILLKQLRSYGIKNVICTPHIMAGVYENTPEIILKKRDILQKHLNKLGLNDINIKVAAEYMLDIQFEQLLKEKKLLTLNEHKILVEMSYHSPPINLYEQLFNIQIAGYKPILAHPERYNFYHQNKNEYYKLKNAGFLFQLNLLSLSNFYGTEVQKVALWLLKEGLIDFVGSDVHHSKHLEALETITTKKTLQLIAPILQNNLVFV